MSGVSTATALAAGSLALGAVGTGLSVVGQMNQQAAMGAQQNYLKALALRNQNIQDMQARDAVARGAVNEQKSRDITGQRLGTQTAVLAGQGTDLSGSPTDILTDTARSGEQDALTIRSNAAREAWGYQIGAGNAGTDAALRGSFQPSYLGAGASLLSGASSLGEKWAKFQYMGGAPAGGGGPSQAYGTEFDL